jgi:hypothetical protein
MNDKYKFKIHRHKMYELQIRASEGGKLRVNDNN